MKKMKYWENPEEKIEYKKKKNMWTIHYEKENMRKKYI